MDVVDWINEPNLKVFAAIYYNSRLKNKYKSG